MHLSQTYQDFLFNERVKIIKGKHKGREGLVLGEAKVMIHICLGTTDKVVKVKKTSAMKVPPLHVPSTADNRIFLDKDTTAALQLLMSSLTRMGINPTSQEGQDIFLSAGQKFNRDNNIDNPLVNK